MSLVNSISTQELIKKYDVPVPRYTSYPTVPHWNTESFSMNNWISTVNRAFTESNDTKGISLYIHLPFCESLCTYCACNTRITKNHGVEERYAEALLHEWDQYLSIFGKRPVIRELHLGGGTPTFYSAANLEKLLTAILSKADIHPLREFSFEGHPNNTTREHLQTLYDLGFRRVSYGVQDLDEKVQRAINRIQPVENLEKVTTLSRAIGYDSVSFDLIYGLPYQTPLTVFNTIEKVIELHPDRIAFYSYAHVPWLRPGQRGYEDADLPTDVQKRALYELGKKMFDGVGYCNIGMDHFALPGDGLAQAKQMGTLHRNFMGYTISQTDLLIGLGASAISDSRYGYAQNEKKVETYESTVKHGKLAVFKGHIQTEQDMLIREAILSISCHGFLKSEILNTLVTEPIATVLSQMFEEGIIEYTKDGLRVTSAGFPFIRNICSVFDSHLNQNHPGTSTFSRGI